MTNCVRTLRVSAVLRKARLDSFPRAEDFAKRSFKKRSFLGSFCNCHAELGLAGQGVIAFKCRFRCPSDMRLDALLGYDGPVRLWVDGKERFHDPNGKNPAVPDKVRVSFVARKGLHEVLVALDSNTGNAWGIYLRFERRDLSRRALAKGPSAYRLPTILG